jgi:hypothetical protein
MKATTLGEQMRLSYRALRAMVAALGVALPLALWIGGHLHGLPLQDSMSGYYHTPMRDELVGMLFAVAASLVAYHGATWLEDWALNLAGLFLVGVALFPVKLDCDGCGFFTVHGTLALLFFACIAYVSIVRSSDTLGLMHDPARERRFRRWYRVLGWLMVASPLLAMIVAQAVDPGSRLRSFVFFAEAVGVYVFAAYWIVKSVELEITGAEALAVQGRLVVPEHGLKHLWKPVPVHHVDEEPPRASVGT